MKSEREIYDQDCPECGQKDAPTYDGHTCCIECWRTKRREAYHRKRQENKTIQPGAKCCCCKEAHVEFLTDYYQAYDRKTFILCYNCESAYLAYGDCPHKPETELL